MKIIVALAVLVSLTACTQQEPSKPDPFRDIACSIGKTVGAVVAVGIQEQLACKNLAAISDSIQDGLVIIKVCDKMPKLILSGNPVCMGLMAAMANTVFAAGVPADWQCEGGPSKQRALEVVQKLCEKVK